MGKPVGTYIQIEPLKRESSSSKIITDYARLDYSRGRVIALGSGVVEGDQKIDWDIEAGEIVYYTGTHATINAEGNKLSFIRHAQIIWSEDETNR